MYIQQSERGDMHRRAPTGILPGSRNNIAVYANLDHANANNGATHAKRSFENVLDTEYHNS